MAPQPDLEAEKGKCLHFLENFNSNEAGDETRLKYMEILQIIADRASASLEIELDDISKFYRDTDPDFVKSVEINGRRYTKLFSAAADALLPIPSTEDIEFDTMDEFLEQAKEREEERRQSQRESLGHGNLSLTTVNQYKDNAAETCGKAKDNTLMPLQNALPPSLTRRFFVYLIPRKSSVPLALRKVDSRFVGHLVKVRGIVTQATDVKPLIQVATYIAEDTGFHYYQEVGGRTFMPLKTIPTDPDEPKNPSNLQFEVMNSKFIKFQEIKLQERADEVPQGETPRVLKILISGPLTRKVKPGDQVVISGLYIPEPYVGFKAIKAGLITNTFLEATKIELDKVSYAETAVSEADVKMIQELSAEGNIYGRLAKSIAPEIFGHEDVKKALLLMMVSGVNVKTTDGMKLRGDIHMCLMGDPGVAKSQLLKFIANMSPRAVYTTGKGSSGVGLTAAVVRDPTTKEVFLEGGALVLADNGICCIDEFDKMDESDRTSIHEVMEQQTVSIAKAGITTRLNARTTVLTAANPAWGRYNIKKSPSENIALPAALLSRFDLLWLILDKPEDEMDRALSDHVLAVRKSGGKSGRVHADGFVPLTPHQLRTYILLARQCNPVLPESLTGYIASVYAELRQENKDPEKAHTYTTPRTLMSIIRLSQSLAKLQFRDEVVQEDLEEALRLMKMSKISLTEDDRRQTIQDPVSAIYRKMNDYWRRSEEARKNGIPFTRIRELCMGITGHGGVAQGDLIRVCIDEYAELGILTEELDGDGNRTIFFLEQ